MDDEDERDAMERARELDDQEQQECIEQTNQ